MTGRVIIYFDGKMLVTVDDVPFWVSRDTMLKAYAEKYAFELHRLTWAWIPVSIPFSALGIQ